MQVGIKRHLSLLAKVDWRGRALSQTLLRPNLAMSRADRRGLIRSFGIEKLDTLRGVHHIQVTPKKRFSLARL